MLCFVVAEKKSKAGCFQSKDADEEACVAVKIEHSRGGQASVTCTHFEALTDISDSDSEAFSQLTCVFPSLWLASFFLSVYISADDTVCAFISVMCVCLQAGRLMRGK